MANSLNKITTKSILDATIATADIADDAVTEDKLANAINTSIAGKAVLTGSTNNTITTVTGANAIQGEANLTFDGSVLTTTQANSAIGAVVKNTTHDSQLQILAEAANKNSAIFFGDAADDDIGYIDYDHNDNSLTVATNTAQAIRVVNNKNVIIGDGTTSSTFLDVRRTDTTVYSATDHTPNGIKVFNDCATDGGFAGIELAATDANDYFGSTVLKSIADGEDYANDFVIQTRHAGNYDERLRLTSEGYVTKLKQPSFSASINTYTDKGTNGSRVLPFDTEFHDMGFFNTTNHRFTAPVPGKYFFILSVNHMGDCIYHIRKNASSVHKGEFRSNTDGSWEHATISGIIVMAAGDYVDSLGELTTSTHGQWLWNGGGSTSTAWDTFTGWLVH